MANYLLLNKPAFGGKPSLCLCHAPMDFDAMRQVLELNLADEQVPDYNDDNLAQVGCRRRPHAKSLLLKFSAGRFIRASK